MLASSIWGDLFLLYLTYLGLGVILFILIHAIDWMRYKYVVRKWEDDPEGYLRMLKESKDGWQCLAMSHEPSVLLWFIWPGWPIPGLGSVAVVALVFRHDYRGSLSEDRIIPPWVYPCIFGLILIYTFIQGARNVTRNRFGQWCLKQVMGEFSTEKMEELEKRWEV